MRMFRLIRAWVRPYWRYAAFALCATLVSVGINLTIPQLTARIIDDGIIPRDTGYAMRTAIVMVALILCAMAASATASAMGVRLSSNTVVDLRRDLYAHIQSLAHADLDRLTSGELLTRLTSDLTKITQLLAMSMSFVAQIPVMFIGALIAILAIDPSLVVVVLVMVPVTAIVAGYTISQSNVLYRLVQGRIDRLNTVLQETIHGAEVIKAFVRQDHEIERFDGVADDLAGDAIKVNQLVASLFPTLILISGLGISAVIWLGGGNVIDGTLTTGELVAFISYMAMVAMPMMFFAFLQPMVSAATASMDRIDEVFAVRPSITEAEQAVDLDLVDRPGDIELVGVGFEYLSQGGESTGEAVSDIDLHIPQGTTVAILGATGSGKSTLVHLLARLYDPTRGTVRIGGVDAREISIESLRRHVGIALQSPQLFSGTVAENLRYGLPGASTEQIQKAASDAQAAAFVSAMADGFDAEVAQGGSNLSGGQRQRLSIARTLIGEPSILILDDSTSAVDLETEARIQEAIEARSDQTVVIVAQRISTALGADEIVVLDRGRVAAHGTHDELLGSSDIYQQIHRSQLGEPAV